MRQEGPKHSPGPQGAPRGGNQSLEGEERGGSEEEGTQASAGDERSRRKMSRGDDALCQERGDGGIPDRKQVPEAQPLIIFFHFNFLLKNVPCISEIAVARYLPCAPSFFPACPLINTSWVLLPSGFPLGSIHGKKEQEI